MAQKKGYVINGAAKTESKSSSLFTNFIIFNEQVLDEVEHDIMNYQNRGLSYLPKPKASADNTDERF